MGALFRAYDGLLHLMAAMAIMALVAATALILGDVTGRATGLGPIRASSALIEYALLFATMFGAPWLVRQRGHITVTSLVDLLPRAVRRVVGAAGMGIATLVLALLAWRAAAIGLGKWRIGAMDVRSISIPDWCAYAILSLGFALMATEFLRLLVRGEVEPSGSSAA